MAGLTGRRLLNEPTAAAMAYGLHETATDCRVFRIGFGRWYFNVTLLELFSGVMEVRSSAGDNSLGGEDFTELLVQGFIGRCQPSQPSHEFWQPYLSLLHGAAETCKRTLTHHKQATMSMTVNDVTYTWAVTE